MRIVSINYFFTSMRTIINFLLLISLSVTLLCCWGGFSEDRSCTLTKSDSLKIIQEIFEITNIFAKSNNELDVKSMVKCWHFENPDFIGVENTLFVNSEGLYERLANFYKTRVDSTNITWMKRDIIPLSSVSAHLYGEYELYIKGKDGQEKNTYVYYSALFTKIEGIWGVLRIQESYK